MGKKIYFTADLHLGHNRVRVNMDRPWDTVEEMDQALIDNINEVVRPKDDLWILGDFSDRISKEKGREILRKIRCRHIHLLRGNHDSDWDTDDGFESVSDYQELETDEGRFVLFHYPIEYWRWRSKGAIHIHGHVHGSREENLHNVETGLRRWDAGVDANEYRPVSLEEIISMFEQKYSE